MSRRLLYLDSYRGFAAFTIIIAHAFSHIMFWDYELIPLDEVYLWLIIMLAPFVLFATCAPVFVLISSTALAYNLHQAVDKYRIQNLQSLQNNSKILIRKTTLWSKFRSSIIGFLLLFLASILHVSLFHYGMNWNGSIQRTLVTGSLEIGEFMWTDFQILFQTDAVGLIALNGLVCSGILLLLWRKNGYQKSKRNYIILGTLVVVWFLLSVLLHFWFDPIFFEALNAGQYLKVFLMKIFIGPPQSSFPNLAYGFLGLFFGIGFAEKKSRTFFRRLGYGSSAVFMSAAGIYILVNGLNLDPASFGSFLPVEIQFLDLGYILLIQMIFMEILEFRTSHKMVGVEEEKSEGARVERKEERKEERNEEKKVKKKRKINLTQVLKRFGDITMTIYIFESLLCVLNLKWYMPLWRIIPSFTGDLYAQVFGFVGLELILWLIIAKLWKKKGYMFSIEWWIVKLRKSIIQRESSIS
ncbi:MAG: hypothetical protein ACTSRK_09000 [Promethearchaeota archaeon]